MDSWRENIGRKRSKKSVMIVRSIDNKSEYSQTHMHHYQTKCFQCSERRIFTKWLIVKAQNKESTSVLLETISKIKLADWGNGFGLG